MEKIRPCGFANSKINLYQPYGKKPACSTRSARRSWTPTGCYEGFKFPLTKFVGTSSCSKMNSCASQNIAGRNGIDPGMRKRNRQKIEQRTIRVPEHSAHRCCLNGRDRQPEIPPQPAQLIRDSKLAVRPI
jgi:hypothetical protein